MRRGQTDVDGTNASSAKPEFVDLYAVPGFRAPPPPVQQKQSDGRVMATAREAGDTMRDTTAAVAAVQALLPADGAWMTVTAVYDQLKHHRQTIRRGWKGVDKFVETFPDRFLLDERRQHIRRVDAAASANAADGAVLDRLMPERRAVRQAAARGGGGASPGVSLRPGGGAGRSAKSVVDPQGMPGHARRGSEAYHTPQITPDVPRVQVPTPTPLAGTPKPHHHHQASWRKGR